jgi:hypothetical protein
MNQSGVMTPSIGKRVQEKGKLIKYSALKNIQNDKNPRNPLSKPNLTALSNILKDGINSISTHSPYKDDWMLPSIKDHAH